MICDESWNGNIFCIAGTLWGKSTIISTFPSQGANNMVFWYVMKTWTSCWTNNLVVWHTRYLNAHTMDLLWEKFQWILPLYMKPIIFQSKASVVCPVTADIFIDFCLKQLNVFSKHIGQKRNKYLNCAEQIPRNLNVDQLSVLITSWDII